MIPLVRATEPGKAQNANRVAQSPDIDAPEDPKKIKEILGQLTSKIDTIEKHVTLETNKLSFLSEVTPKN